MKNIKIHIVKLLVSVLLIIPNTIFGQVNYQIDLTSYNLSIKNIKGDDGNNYSKVLLQDLSPNQLVSTPELPVKYVKLRKGKAL